MFAAVNMMSYHLVTMSVARSSTVSCTGALIYVIKVMICHYFDDHMIDCHVGFHAVLHEATVQASSIEFSSKFEVTLEWGDFFSFFLTWSCDVPAVT